MSTEGLSRRHALATAAVAGVGLPLLSACAGESDEPAPGSTGTPSEAPEAGAAFASTSDVAVGGCAVFPDIKLVLTQPSEGEFKCFSAVCTHQGCLVSSGTDGVIPCTCHGSRFSLEDGSVLEGPATRPLAEVSITVEGDQVARA